MANNFVLLEVFRKYEEETYKRFFLPKKLRRAEFFLSKNRITEVPKITEKAA